MSTHFIKHQALYESLKESIDFEKARAVPLSVGNKIALNIDGVPVGIKLERCLSNTLFKQGTILHSEYNPGTYFNLGFDVEESTSQVRKETYKELAKILGVIAKSIFEWIKKNNPEVLTIFPEGATDKEREKKLNIYYSILQANKEFLKSIGYSFDYYTFTTGVGVYIKKN